MKIYFYHTVRPDYIYEQWRQGKFPGHTLYGATYLPEHGIEVICHKLKTNPNINRWKASLELIPAVFSRRKEISAVYGTSFRGMELLIFLRTLRIFNKPIVIWHHQPIVINGNPIREVISRFFYKGIDYMFFFSEEIYRKSLQTHKVEKNGEICPWGCDLPYYDKLMAGAGNQVTREFISTGKEHRDFATLMNAFKLCPNQHLFILTTSKFAEEDYEETILKYMSPNVELEINKSKWIPEIAEMILPYRCVCICCKETNYTVGLTTLVEAMAFGKPVIVTRNPNFPFDVDKEGIGISVQYNDVDGWRDAIRFISSHPEEAEEMGRRGRLLAEKIYNVKNTAKLVANVIRQINQISVNQF